MHHSEIAGLLDVMRQLVKAQNRGADLSRRVLEADSDLHAAIRNRKTLVARAANGEAVTAAEASRVETAIRACEDKLAVLKDAVPPVAEVEKAAIADVAAVLHDRGSRLHREAVEKYERAKVDFQKAQDHLNETVQAQQSLQGYAAWNVWHMYREQIAQCEALIQQEQRGDDLPVAKGPRLAVAAG